MSVLVELPTLLLQGRFKLTVLDKQGKVVRKTGWRPNLITDAGLNRVLDNNNGILGPQMVVGTGNTPPSYSDTTLSNQVAWTTGSGLSGGLRAASEYWVRRTYTFPIGVIDNQNIAELGLRHTTTNYTTLMTRALVTDESGNPTTITVTSEESLVVTYEARSIPDKTVVTGSFPIDYYEGPTFIETIMHDFTAQANGFGRSFSTNADGSTGLLNARMSGRNSNDLQAAEDNTPIGQDTSATASSGGTNFSSYNVLPRDGSAMYRDTEFTLNTGVANFASGIGQVRFYNSANTSGPWWGIYITPKIPKTADHTFRITVRNSVGRA